MKIKNTVSWYTNVKFRPTNAYHDNKTAIKYVRNVLTFEATVCMLSDKPNHG